MPPPPVPFLWEKEMGLGYVILGKELNLGQRVNPDSSSCQSECLPLVSAVILLRIFKHTCFQFRQDSNNFSFIILH